MMDVGWGFKALRDQLCILNAIWASEHVSSRLKILVFGKNEIFVILITKSMAGIPWILENVYIVHQRWSFLQTKNAHPTCVPSFIEIENWIFHSKVIRMKILCCIINDFKFFLLFLAFLQLPPKKMFLGVLTFLKILWKSDKTRHKITYLFH